MVRGAKQHRGMAVVAAGVHFPGVRGCMREGVEFLHRQRVHVGSQSDGRIAAAALDDADDARHAHAAQHRDAPLSQLLGDDVGSALLFVAQLWVGMDVASDLLQFGLKLDDGID